MVTRTIVLDRSKPELTVTARAERFAPSPLPVELWTVTQARRPEYGLLGLDSDFYPGDRRWRLMRKSGTPVQVGEFGDLLEVRFGQKGWEKISSWGRLVAAVYPGVIFLQEFRRRAVSRNAALLRFLSARSIWNWNPILPSAT